MKLNILNKVNSPSDLKKLNREELNLLSEDFRRYKDRWDKLYRSIETVSKDVKDIHTTTEKITKKFDSINKVELVEEDPKKLLSE